MAKRQHDGGVKCEEHCLGPAPPAEAEMLDVMISGLSDLDADQLRLQWRNHLGGSAPAHLPRWLLLRVLAFRVQAAALGDLGKATLRLLRLSKDESVGSCGVRPFETRGPTTHDGIGLKAGALLVREWNGELERVMILEKGFAWRGKRYRSLSQIAKAMTGTNWNGHRFFGLRPSGEQRARSNAINSRILGVGELLQTIPSTSTNGKSVKRSASEAPRVGERNGQGLVAQPSHATESIVVSRAAEEAALRQHAPNGVAL